MTMTGVKNINYPGKFKIPEEWIQNKPSLIRHIMNNMIVIRAEYIMYDRCIHYHAFSPLFLPVKDGCKISEYSIDFKNDEDFYFQKVS